MANTARAYPGFHKYEETKWDASPSQVTPPPPSPTFCQVSLTVTWYPFIRLGGGRHCKSKVSYPEHNTITRPGLKPGPLDPEVQCANP